MNSNKLHCIPRPVLLQYPANPPFDLTAWSLKTDGMGPAALAWADDLMALAPFQQLPPGMARQSLGAWAQRQGTLPEGFDPAQGYALAVDAAGVTIAADSDAGWRYALQTLAQLLAQARDGRLPAVNIIDWPVMRRRCAHVCYHLATDWMPESVPDFTALLRLIKLVAHFKMNCLLLEIEAMFPHQKHKIISARHAFTMEQIREIGKTCQKWGVEIIPLLQSLGHAYHVLCHPEYAHLRETPDTSQQYCPSNPAVLPFYLELADEIRAAFPEIKRFHIGGDESRRLGVCPACADAVKRGGIGELYGKHIGATAGALLKRGLTPLLWTDIIEHYPAAAGHIPAGAEFVYWKYALPRNGTGIDFAPFMRRGATWAAAGVRFGNCNNTMYRFPEALQGISFLSAEAQRVGCDSFIVTDWMKAIPFELSEPGYAYAAEAAWGTRRPQTAFFDDYAILACGAAAPPITATAGKNGSDLLTIFELLSYPLIPFCEDAQAHQTAGGLDRYDLSGLTFRERIAALMNAADKAKTLARLQTGMQHGREALEIIEQLRGTLPADWRVLRLLELSARTNAHKARLGLALEQAIRLLKYPGPDDGTLRGALVKRFAELIEEDDRLRAATETLLAPVMIPAHLAANLNIKFEPAAREWMRYFRDGLQRGNPIRFVLGMETGPAA